MYKMATVGGGGGWRIFLGIFIRLYRVADRLWQVGSEAVCCPTASWMERNGLTRQFVTVTTTDPPSGSNCAPSRAIQCGVCAYFIAQRALFPPLCCECECFYLWKTSEHSSVAGLSTDFFYKKEKENSLRVHRCSNCTPSINFHLLIAHSLQIYFCCQSRKVGLYLCAKDSFSFPSLPPTNMCWCPTHTLPLSLGLSRTHTIHVQ